MVLWDEVCREVVAGDPALEVDWMLVNGMTMRMVLRPSSADTVLAPNLHADLLTDLASTLSGSLGLGATGNLDPERRGPSMFEPIHGAAFDLVGKSIANSIGAFWSAALMIEHLSEAPSTRRSMAAIERVASEATVLPQDLGGTASTQEVKEAVIAGLRARNAEAPRGG